MRQIRIMRQMQIALFGLGVAALVASAFGRGPEYGETFLKIGIALLLIDVVCIQLWPAPERP